MPWQCVVLVILGVSACTCTRMMKMHTAPLGMDRPCTGQRKPKKKAFAKKQLKRKRAQQQRQLANIVTPSARPAVTLCTSLRTEVDSVHEQRPASAIGSRADSPKPVLHPDVVRREEGIHCGSGQVSPADSACQLAYLSSSCTSLKNAQPRWCQHVIECLTTMKSAAAAAGASHCILAAAALGAMMVLLLHSTSTLADAGPPVSSVYVATKAAAVLGRNSASFSYDTNRTPVALKTERLLEAPVSYGLCANTTEAWHMSTNTRGQLARSVDKQQHAEEQLCALLQSGSDGGGSIMVQGLCDTSAAVLRVLKKSTPQHTVTCSQRTPRHDSDTGDKWASGRGCTRTAEHNCDCRIAARLTTQVFSVSHANGARATVSSQSFDVQHDVHQFQAASPAILGSSSSTKLLNTSGARRAAVVYGHDCGTPLQQNVATASVAEEALASASDDSDHQSERISRSCVATCAAHPLAPAVTWEDPTDISTKHRSCDINCSIQQHNQHCNETGHPRYCGRRQLSCLCATSKSAATTTSTRSSTTQQYALLSITACQTPITEQYTSRAISVAIPRSKAQNDLCGPGSAGSNLHVLSGVPESAEFTAWLVYAMTLLSSAWPLALLLVRSGGRNKAAKLSLAVIMLCTSPI